MSVRSPPACLFSQFSRVSLRRHIFCGEPLLRAAIAALEAKVTPEHVWLKGARATLAALERKRERRWFW